MQLEPRYDDPAFAIAWPMPPTAIADKDLAWPDFVDPPWFRQPADEHAVPATL